MSAHLEWSAEVGADIVIGGEGRRHCEIGELPEEATSGDDPVVNICHGCPDAGQRFRRWGLDDTVRVWGRAL